MTAPTTTPSEPGFYDLLTRLHGHRCPMSILGARLGAAAVEALAPAPGVRLQARYHCQTCALDGIQLATGCTAGNGGLRLEPGGRHLLVLGTEDGARTVAVELTEAALDRGRTYARLRDRVGTDPAVEADMVEILKELETAPTPELVRPAVEA